MIAAASAFEVDTMIQTDHRLPFVHLRVQSAYSIGVGVSTPGEICAYANRSGFDAVALTDIGGTWGFVEFHRAAVRHEVKPIYGVTLNLGGEGAPGGAAPQLVLIALDRIGLKNVCALTSEIDTDGTAEPFVRLDKLKRHSDGVVCVVESPQSEDENGSRLNFAPEATEPLEILDKLLSLFGDRLFVGLAPGATESAEQWIAVADDVGIAKVLTQDVRYVGFKHFSLVAAERGEAGTGAPDENEGVGVPVDRFRFLTRNEVTQWYGDYPEAYTNASMIASLVHPDLLSALDEPVPASSAPTLFRADGEYQDALEYELGKGFEREFSEASTAERERQREIIDRELGAIRESGTAESLHRFHEIVSQVRRHHIPLGPSTGLRLQSLCAYLLGITEYNPYQVDDHFVADLEADPAASRILDLQVASADRAVTMTVLEQMFADAAVGYVPLIEHVTPLRALKVAGREIDIRDDELADVIRIAGDHPGVPLMKLCEDNVDIGRLYKRSAGVRELVATAAIIEGLPIGFIRSKRTLIVSPRSLDQFLGHNILPETGERFYQATRDVFPTESVFRIDVTTLTSLGVCSNVYRYLEDSAGAENAWHRPVDDASDAEKVFGQIADGNLEGVYLLESPLTRRLALDFDVGSFGDLVNFLALMRFRRGDLSFAKRVEAFKKGPPPSERLDPAISFLLNDTQGWVLYYDQLREILSVLTGLAAPEALTLLRRFERQDGGSLAALRKDFMGHTVETELPLEEAVSWFKRIRYYATHTLDRQRILADALLVYRMLWLKRHHRAAFFAALLNEHRDHGGRFDVYLGIVEAEGLLLAPQVNRSGTEYRPEGGLIRPPLSRIEGLGEAAIQAILQVRADGEFVDLEDFIRRVPPQHVTNEEVELIAAAGAVDAGDQLGKRPGPFHPARRKGGPREKTEDKGQLAFDLNGGGVPPEVPSIKKDGNIRSAFRVLANIAEFYPHPVATRVELVGRVRDLRTFNTSSGDETRFFVLFDTSASVPVFAPIEGLGRPGEPTADGDRVLVRGIVRIRDRKKVCDAVEVLAEGGATSDGETTSDEPAGGDS